MRHPTTTLFPYTTLFRSFVYEAHDENGEEDHHRPEAEGADLVERHRPREEKGDFQVEQDEQDRNRSEEHTSELQSHSDLVCRLLLEKKKRRPEAVLLTSR